VFGIEFEADLRKLVHALHLLSEADLNLISHLYRIINSGAAVECSIFNCLVLISGACLASEMLAQGLDMGPGRMGWLPFVSENSKPQFPICMHEVVICVSLLEINHRAACAVSKRMGAAPSGHGVQEEGGA